ncbi:MAG: helix-turn-helix domain-containing protein [Blastomonas fulva]|uniref:transcriptional regulator n=1 Tax=Blastomonas fulva TaxID=1550728 RepID=UPI0024E2132B|nr:helix-turn-helix domain-containing protein [Blastomonas fulva]MDK2757530.1 helix-turn-helix domain-containing protein [Blastomonas fulva]
MIDRESSLQAFHQAIDIVGGQSAFGRLIGRSQSTVWDWVDRKKLLPPEYVLTIEAATGISKHELRPDIYPIDLSPAPASEAVSPASNSGGANIPDGRTSSFPDANLDPVEASQTVAGGEAARSDDDPGRAADTAPIGKAAA